MMLRFIWRYHQQQCKENIYYEKGVVGNGQPLYFSATLPPPQTFLPMEAQTTLLLQKDQGPTFFREMQIGSFQSVSHRMRNHSQK